jgi:hypothetical protein
MARRCQTLQGHNRALEEQFSEATEQLNALPRTVSRADSGRLNRGPGEGQEQILQAITALQQQIGQQRRSTVRFSATSKKRFRSCVQPCQHGCANLRSKFTKPDESKASSWNAKIR